MDGRMDGGIYGGMDAGMDAGRTVKWTVGWTVVGRWVDGIQKFWNGMVTEGGRDGHGRWTGWSRKVDGMVTESGR